MNFDEQKLFTQLKIAETDELLDQVTAYRRGTEPAAIELIEKELHRRGISATKIAERRETCERTCIFLGDGVAAMCSFCRKPAVRAEWGWHKLMGVVPILPRWLRYCARHARAR